LPAGFGSRPRSRVSSAIGPHTTALIQPAFYADLAFDSIRLPRHLQLESASLPELSVQLVAPMAGPGDPVLAAAAAARVRELLQSRLLVHNEATEWPVGASDIAVITPHVEQASAVAARLADVPGVLIATANQAQGMEREAVVVLHPLAGYRDAPSFAIEPGRNNWSRGVCTANTVRAPRLENEKLPGLRSWRCELKLSTHLRSIRR
jgi:hypothetical protein